MHATRHDRWLRQTAAGLALAVLWYGAWRLGAVAGTEADASLWYPPAGLTLALALTLGPRHLVVLVIAVGGGSLLSGTAMATTEFGVPPLRAMTFALIGAAAHAVPYVAGAMLLRRHWHAWWQPGDVRQVVALLVATPLMAGAAAIGGFVVLRLEGGPLGVDAATTVATSLLGDWLGAATLAPILVLLLVEPLARWLGPGVNPAARAALGWAVGRPSLVLCGISIVAAALPFAADRIDVPQLQMLLTFLPVIAVMVVALSAPTLCALGSAAMIAAATATAGARSADVILDPQLAALAIVVVSHLSIVVTVLRRDSGHDALTGVANRRRLEESASVFLARPPVSVIMVDLDDFKAWNDAYGHAGGDAVLVATARYLRGSVRSSDVVARIGGDEFLLVVAADVPHAARMAEQLRVGLATVRPHGRAALVVSASFGVAAVAGGGPAALRRAIDDAGRALLDAKRAGRNRAVTQSTADLADAGRHPG
ncbi:MAG: diguanylate cyclase [Pseudomonadota bacterium]